MNNISLKYTPLTKTPIQRSPQQQKVEEFREYIEKEVLVIIKDLAEKGQTPPERIQEMAKLTLELVKPGMTFEQLYHNAAKLDDQYSELAPVVVKLMREYEDKFHKKALESVSLLIKNGKYDDAQSMVKKVLQYKMNE
jgi:hypothetical protein